ncbi:MAG: hypothetical protein ACRD0C_12535, partial [Acidimicrobiia bacterium]
MPLAGDTKPRPAPADRTASQAIGGSGSGGDQPAISRASAILRRMAARCVPTDDPRHTPMVFSWAIRPQ